jgi:hypothetical protein
MKERREERGDLVRIEIKEGDVSKSYVPAAGSGPYDFCPVRT